MALLSIRYTVAGTHEATKIPATHHSNTSQQQISSCEQENFIENFVTATDLQLQTGLILCDMLQRQNSVVVTKF